MKPHHIILGACLASTVAFSSCDDETTTIGSSLITDNSEIVIDSTFTITGVSRQNSDLPSRSLVQILGNLSAKEYGSFFSEIVTQFMPSLQLDTVGVGIDDIDSMKLMMFYVPGDFTGDSLVPMGLKVYPLTKELPSPIYSDFDPTGYYDANNPWTPNTIYTGNALYNDSINNLSYRTVSVSLPLSFAKKFYSEYLTTPSTFATPQAFAEFFPGIYIQNSFGSGRVINFSEMRVNMYYRRHATVTVDDVERDTVYKVSSSYMAVTPEVVSNNIIKMELSPSLKQMANDGQSLLVAPAGYDVEMIFPTAEILRRYRENGGDMSVINTLTLSLPVEEISNSYGIEPPLYVLLVLSKDKDSFFANNKITDDTSSFLGIYDSDNKTYDFTGLRPYIIEMLGKSSITADDYTFTLTPVNVETETSQSSYYSTGQTYITAITPYISGPAMCKIKFDEAKIKFTYSKQSIKN